MNTPPAPFAAIIVAAGKGLRAGGGTPKQFRMWQGKPVVRHSAESLLAAGASPLIVAIPADAQDMAASCLTGLDNVQLVAGGATRQASVHAALTMLETHQPARVLIHDAARPIVPAEVIARLLGKLEAYPAAIPVLSVVDSLARAQAGEMAGTARREELRRVQTPQAFHFPQILAAHQNWAGAPDAGDDAQVAAAAGMAIALTEGDERMRKLTFAEDFMTAEPAFRIGMGYDVHRLVADEELWLCGVHIPHEYGLAGHSDADVAIHALVDALLGAIGAGDIGQHFPPSDPQWRNASSDQFLTYAISKIEQAGYMVGNVDLTLICEAPKIGPHRNKMRARLAKIMKIDESLISVKATTTEGLGFTGRGEGIAAKAAVLVMKSTSA